MSRVFSDGTGLHETDLTIEPGEFVSVLGPSGCGKSTLLRCLAGLEDPQTGTIRFGDRVVYDAGTGKQLPARRRGIGMVFQDLALWPHLTASENVAFPLRVGHVERAEIPGRVAEALGRVGLAAFATKMPHQLSGGQQQRVAIARAIVANPRVLLMDEPFSALDAALRVDLRAELRELTTSLGLTTVYVTHDQTEAMSMSDRVVVLEAGNVRQFDTPETVYLHPANPFVAGFIGRFNRLPGEESGVRPERVRVVPTGDQASTDAIVLDAVVRSCAYGGGSYELRCDVAGTDPWIVDTPEAHAAGEQIRLAVRAADLILTHDSGASPRPSAAPAPAPGA